SRIITTTLETAIDIIDYGMEPQEAVDAARIHEQWLPDVVYYEPYGLSADTLKILASEGYKMVQQTPWGAAELVEVGLPGLAADASQSSGNDSSVGGKVRVGYFYGANDERRPAGEALGY